MSDEYGTWLLKNNPDLILNDILKTQRNYILENFRCYFINKNEFLSDFIYMKIYCKSIGLFLEETPHYFSLLIPKV